MRVCVVGCIVLFLFFVVVVVVLVEFGVWIGDVLDFDGGRDRAEFEGQDMN
jgi:hypothetical protein